MGHNTQPGDVLSYTQMCLDVGVNLQRGMNFRLRNAGSVILMSVRPGAPYADTVESEGKVLIYEGHDAARTANGPSPKELDQPEHNPGGSLTQNGLFADAARRYKQGKAPAEPVHVYEKIRPGIWVYNGLFLLSDCWIETQGSRRVFKFRLEFTGVEDSNHRAVIEENETRLIPTAVKLEVWHRDRGQCVTCGAASNLHFDHIIPYSKGGSSKDPANIQILCGRHNIAKRDRIE